MKKNILFIVICVVAVVGIIFLLNPQSVDDFSDERLKKPVIGNVEVTIDCTTLLNQVNKPASIPTDGMLLSVSIELREDDTVYDILIAACKDKNISVDSTGTALKYVKTIAGISEFDFGGESGWLYYVNNVQPEASSSQYSLKDGDKVLWFYSCRIGDKP